MNLSFHWLSVELWVKVTPLVFSGFFLFYSNSVGRRPSVSSYPCYLPGHFHLRLVGLDREAVVDNFLRDNCLRKLANHGQLISKILIEGLKVMRQCDVRLSIDVSRDIAVVDIQHVGGLDEGVPEILGFWVQRVVDRKAATPFRQRAGDKNSAKEHAGIIPTLATHADTTKTEAIYARAYNAFAKDTAAILT